MAATVSSGEIYRAPRSRAEHFNEVDRGGHVAAWEEPKVFSNELRAAFRPLR